MNAAVPEALAAGLTALADQAAARESLQELIAFRAGLHVRVTVLQYSSGHLPGVVQTHRVKRAFVGEPPV